MNWKRWILFVFSLGLLAFVFGLGSNYWIYKATKSQVFEEIEEVPQRSTGLLLGTSKTIAGKYHNPYFQKRIRAAANLYKAGKIKHIIVSGDHGTKTYNEPADMREALMELGVPSNAITLDYAGFRTLDSVVRCKKVFQQAEITIISQPFHTPRALFLANAYSLNAIAFNTEEVYRSNWNKTKIREYLARAKAVLDVYILRKQPKYLGEKINIEIS